MIANLVSSRWWDQWGEPLKQFVPLHQNVGRAVAPSGLETVAEATIGLDLKAIETNRRAQNIAAQTFQSSLFSSPRFSSSRITRRAVPAITRVTSSNPGGGSGRKGPGAWGGPAYTPSRTMLWK